MRLPLLTLVAATTLAACAKMPDAITPAAMPAGAYDALTCAAAQVERAAITANLAALSSQQTSAATGDILSVFLLGIPVSGLAGSDKEGLLAVEKGKALAVAARLARC